jgi:hypothetical protein
VPHRDRHTVRDVAFGEEEWWAVTAARSWRHFRREGRPLLFVTLLVATIVLFVFELWAVLAALVAAALLVALRRKPPPPAV